MVDSREVARIGDFWRVRQKFIGQTGEMAIRLSEQNTQHYLRAYRQAEGLLEQFGRFEPEANRVRKGRFGLKKTETKVFSTPTVKTSFPTPQGERQTTDLTLAIEVPCSEHLITLETGLGFEFVITPEAIVILDSELPRENSLVVSQDEIALVQGMLEIINQHLTKPQIIAPQEM